MRAVDEQLSVQTRLDRWRSVHTQFNSDHHALDAHVLDEWTALPQRLETLLEISSQLFGALKQSAGLDDFDGGKGGGASQRVPPEGGGVRARPEFLRGFRLRYQRSRSDPAGQRLGQRHDIRLDFPVLMRKPATCPAHAGLHFVENQ